MPAHVAIATVTGEDPPLVLVQGKNWVRVALKDVKALVVALTDAATELVTVQLGSGKEDSRNAAN